MISKEGDSVQSGPRGNSYKDTGALVMQLLSV